MPVRWTIDPARKLVETVIDGDPVVEDAHRFFDAIEAAGAIPYKKLFDVRGAVAKIDETIMSVIGKRIAGYTNQGPFAVIVPGAYFDGLARLFLLVVGADGRARVFRTEEEARGWLDSIEFSSVEKA